MVPIPKTRSGERSASSTKSGAGWAAIRGEWPDRPISALKGFEDDDRRLQGADDLPALQSRFVLELPGNLRVERGPLSGAAARPDHRRRSPVAIMGGAAGQP